MNKLLICSVFLAVAVYFVSAGIPDVPRKIKCYAGRDEKEHYYGFCRPRCYGRCASRRHHCHHLDNQCGDGDYCYISNKRYPYSDYCYQYDAEATYDSEEGHITYYSGESNSDEANPTTYAAIGGGYATGDGDGEIDNGVSSRPGNSD